MKVLSNPPVKALDTILLWPFALQSQGVLFKTTRGDREKSPSDWLREYAIHITRGEPQWRRISDPLDKYFGAELLYEPQQQYAEFVYLHPFIQKLLYESDDRRRAIEVLVRNDICQLEVTLSRNPAHVTQAKAWPREPQKIVLQVRRIQLFLFTSDLAVLAVELELPDAEKHDFHLACDVVNQIRRVYAPYFNLKEPTGPTSDCPFSARWVDCAGETVGEPTNFFDSAPTAIAETRKYRRAPLAPHWASLLFPLKPWDQMKGIKGEREAREESPSALCYEQLGDERAYTMVRLALANPHALPEHQHYRLAYLDSADTGFAYNRDFLRKQSPFYDRFWNETESWMTTRYAISGYSFTMLVSDYELNLKGGRGPLFRGHFRHHYFFLNLLAVMQRGSLLIFWDRLSNLLREYSTEGNNRPAFHDDQRWLSEDFAHYLARFEFSEVSNQIQGRELFDQLRDSMRIKSLNQEVLDQLRYAREIEESNYEEESAKRLNQISKLWVPVGLTFSLLGLSVGMDDLWCWMNGLPNCGFDPWRLLRWIVVVGTTLLFFRAINLLWIKRGERR